ncbi:hypothetical protein SUGI_0762610 [Cryptomeria japonica]|uniref:uncharacterized protein C227.17c n=1 Tax=Cryptomeria japonica TaxID=3369 RepID=UPI0024147D75|nr:uncharacterized protein C227.17c [Cryptomeria japonica]GLJ37530.1 hypothetical protein SUGI_0762610 [Cryptomeria japonica]
MAEEDEGLVSPVLKRNLSCTERFDELWFCYSPVYQMKQYYRYGTFDTCFEKWSAVFDCLRLKTKRKHEVQKILEARERDQPPHIWKMRTFEEASANWNSMYGHLNEYE